MLQNCTMFAAFSLLSSQFSQDSIINFLNQGPLFKSDLPITLYEMSFIVPYRLSAFCHRLYMGKLVPLFLLSDGSICKGEIGVY